MARISPLSETEWSPTQKEAFQKHILKYKGRITNMKATLGHSSLVFDTYMQWYPLYEEVKLILGDRLACYLPISFPNQPIAPCALLFSES